MLPKSRMQTYQERRAEFKRLYPAPAQALVVLKGAQERAKIFKEIYNREYDRDNGLYQLPTEILINIANACDLAELDVRILRDLAGIDSYNPSN